MSHALVGDLITLISSNHSIMCVCVCFPCLAKLHLTTYCSWFIHFGFLLLIPFILFITIDYILSSWSHNFHMLPFYSISSRSSSCLVPISCLAQPIFIWPMLFKSTPCYFHCPFWSLFKPNWIHSRLVMCHYFMVHLWIFGLVLFKSFIKFITQFISIHYNPFTIHYHSQFNSCLSHTCSRSFISSFNPFTSHIPFKLQVMFIYFISIQIQANSCTRFISKINPTSFKYSLQTIKMSIP